MSGQTSSGSTAGRWNDQRRVGFRVKSLKDLAARPPASASDKIYTTSLLTRQTPDLAIHQQLPEDDAAEEELTIHSTSRAAKSSLTSPWKTKRGLFSDDHAQPPPFYVKNQVPITSPYRMDGLPPGE